MFLGKNEAIFILSHIFEPWNRKPSAILERYMKSGQAPQNPFEKIKDMAQEVEKKG